jgi:hypothetical protein
MARSTDTPNNSNRPDFYRDEDAHKYPHLGGVFHDVVPDGETALTMHGATADADPAAKAAVEETKQAAKARKK